APPRSRQGRTGRRFRFQPNNGAACDILLGLDRRGGGGHAGPPPPPYGGDHCSRGTGGVTAALLSPASLGGSNRAALLLSFVPHRLLAALQLHGLDSHKGRFRPGFGTGWSGAPPFLQVVRSFGRCDCAKQSLGKEEGM